MPGDIRPAGGAGGHAGYGDQAWQGRGRADAAGRAGRGGPELARIHARLRRGAPEFRSDRAGARRADDGGSRSLARMTPDAGRGVLLDTCAVIWLAEGAPMARAALEAVTEAAMGGGVHVSSV